MYKHHAFHITCKDVAYRSSTLQLSLRATQLVQVLANNPFPLQTCQSRLHTEEANLKKSTLTMVCEYTSASRSFRVAS